ncbi:tumor necrosis factor receptor superfamily member 9 [Mixophyes fleayi]|uniref:tumor necrosis factor receptor superfamily member 9 n=1 Tax=Mixophyes fleayi TaxID=3061075 RepID=UPI003F4E24D0
MEATRWNLQACLLIMLHAGIGQGQSCYDLQDGCCKKCNPGYFLTGTCGKCNPCPLKGYVDRPNNMPFCNQCQRCEGIFQYKETCTSTKNAVCECISGKKCANEKCTKCENNPCPAGQQLQAEKCVNCPHGTFNPGTEGICKPWKNCSALGVLANGTHASDVVCVYHIVRATARPTTSSEVTSTTYKPVEKATSGLTNKDITIIVIVTSFFLLLCLIVFGLCFSVELLEKMKSNFKKIPHPIVKQTEQEDDNCSCHYPEEEHGEDEPMTRDL